MKGKMVNFRQQEVLSLQVSPVRADGHQCHQSRCGDLHLQLRAGVGLNVPFR